MKATSNCLIHPNGPEEWIASMQDSLAKILASPAEGAGSMASEADYTAKSSASLTWYDPITCSWRTRQQSLVEGLDTFSETWPRAGTMRDGQCWPLLTWVRPINANAGGVLHGVPTPTVCGNYNRKGASATSGDGLATWVWQTPVADDAVARKAGKWNSRGEPKLSAQVKLPTPLARDYRSGKVKRSAKDRGHTPCLPEVLGGTLNPVWVEWLMGWPIGYTELKRSATDKSRSARRQPGKFLVGPVDEK
jgi:hypothetical protein